MKQDLQTITYDEMQVEPEKSNKIKKRRRIGLMGGSFNPPHIGHLLVAESVYETLDLDAVHFMPTHQPGHVDTKTTIDAKYRIDMVDFAIEDNPHFSLNLTEVNRGGTSYTIDTIKELKEANPETDYFFIIGADMVNDLPNWKEIDNLLQMVQFVGVKRPGYTAQTDLPIMWVDVTEVAVSSSQIRQKVSEDQSIKYVTPDRVIDYIEDKGLYKNDR